MVLNEFSEPLRKVEHLQLLVAMTVKNVDTKSLAGTLGGQIGPCVNGCFGENDVVVTRPVLRESKGLVGILKRRVDAGGDEVVCLRLAFLIHHPSIDGLTSCA